MASSLELFELIKSLTSNEKRHFQLSTALQNGKKNYVLLFEEMDAQEDYNKELILEKLANYKFVKSLHVTENYLYRKIMESLRSFYADKYITTQLYNLLTDATILNRRGLYKLSLEMLNKAERIALQHHKTLVLAEIAPRKIELLVAEKNKKLLEQLEELYQQIQKLQQQVEKESTYVYWHHWMVLVFRKWRDPQDPAILQKMEEGFQLVAQNPFPVQGTFPTQDCYYTIQSLYYQITKQYEKGNAIHAKTLALWEQHPHIIKEKLSVYMARLANYINSSLTCQQGELVEELIAKMEALKAGTFDEEGEQFQNVYFYKQLYYLNTQQLETAQALIPIIEEGLERYAQKINPARKLAFYYNSTTTYFLSEQYEQAADWLEKILLITKTHEPRKDVQRFARILEMAICYKLGKYRVLESLVRSIDRNKKLKEEMHVLEQLTLQYFKKLLKLPPNSREERALFQEFKQALQGLSPAKKRGTGFEEFSLWVEKMG